MNLKVFKVLLNGSANSSCAQSPTPKPGLMGAFVRLVSPGGGAFAKFALPVGRAFANPGATPSFRHARGFLSKYNYTGFYWKNKQIGSFFKDGKKMKRFVKACSRFYACISSLLIKLELHSEIGSYRRETTFFFGYWIKLLLILFEQHPFVFIKLLITVNFTVHY